MTFRIRNDHPREVVLYKGSLPFPVLHQENQTSKAWIGKCSPWLSVSLRNPLLEAVLDGSSFGRPHWGSAKLQKARLCSLRFITFSSAAA